MNIPDRHRFKWSINEVLALHREYDLLGLSINEIALRHKRKPGAIVYKLINENLICEEEDDDFDTTESIEDTAHLYESDDEELEQDDVQDEDKDEELEQDDVQDEDEDEDEDEELEEDYEQQDLSDALFEVYGENYDGFIYVYEPDDYTNDEEEEEEKDNIELPYAEKKEPEQNDDDIVEMYIYEYIIHWFKSYFFPDTTKYRYRIFY